MQCPQVQDKNQFKCRRGGFNKGCRSHFATQMGESVRKIRVICNDPDATDSSSDDEKDVGVRCWRRKPVISSGGISGRTLIYEIVVPIPSSAALMIDFERSSYIRSRKRRVTKSNNIITNKKKQLQMKRPFCFLAGDVSSSKYNGATKWAADDGRSARGVDTWLDTARAYERTCTETDDGVSSPIMDRSNNHITTARVPVNSTTCLSEDDDNGHFSLSSPSSVLDPPATFPSWNMFTWAGEGIDGREHGSRHGESPATGTQLMDVKKEPMIPSSLHDLAGFQHRENYSSLAVEFCTKSVDMLVLNALVCLAEESDDNIGSSQESLNVDVDAEVLSWLNF